MYFSLGHGGRRSPTKTLLYRHNRRSKGNAGCPSYPALCILRALHCFCSNNHTCKNTPPRLRLSLYTRPLSQKNAKITHFKKNLCVYTLSIMFVHNFFDCARADEFPCDARSSSSGYNLRLQNSSDKTNMNLAEYFKNEFIE